MGTSALINVLHEGKTFVTIYNQWAGHPSRIGDEIKGVLGEVRIGNGLTGLPVSGRMANGMECAAAQLVAALKEGPDGVYLYKAGTKDLGEDYAYNLFALDGRIMVTAYDCDTGGIIYSGPLASFDGAEVERKMLQRELLKREMLEREASGRWPFGAPRDG